MMRTQLKTNEVAGLIEDFKGTSDEKEFLSENDSDTNIDENFQFESAVNKTVASTIFKGNERRCFWTLQRPRVF